MIYRISDFITAESNCTSAFVSACQALRDGDTLCLDGGVYHLWPEGAFRKEYYISNNDCGEKPIALPLLGKRNVTVDGGGAELIFHGKMLPVVMDGSEGVTLKGLAIDYHTPFYAQADILEADRESILLGFDGVGFNCRVRNGNFCFYSPEDGWEWEVERGLSLEFDGNGHPSAVTPPYFPYTGAPKDHGFLGGMYHTVRLVEEGKNRIRMYADTACLHHAGCHFIMTFSGREYPGIFVNDSKDVTLSDIRLYHTAAMGVIAQTTENILLERVVAQPREGSGRLLSVNADATHFVNCRGAVTQIGCKYVQMMDDAANIHGIYHLYQGQNPDGSLRLGFGHFQQKGMQTYRAGDEVAVIDSETNTVRARGHVLEAELISPDEVRLLLDCPVPPPGAHDVTENLSTAPDVLFRDCESGYNRPRGFLISSAGKVLVENCRFYNMEQGIQLSGEMRDWYESGHVEDVTIRNCDFNGSAYAYSVAILCRPVLRCTDTTFNGRVVIQSNTFTQSSKRICAVERTREVVFTGNRFVWDPTLPPKPAYGEGGVSFTRCDSVTAEPVTDVTEA
jgi:hypothetical protein